MFGHKAEQGDDIIDGDKSSVLSKVKSAMSSSPPYIVYGGLMMVASICLALVYILYKTFNTKVIVLLVVAGLAFAYLTYAYSLAHGVGALVLILVFGGMVVAYSNLKGFAAIDATVVPAAGSAIDERWHTPEVLKWLRANNLDKFESRFRDASVDGAMLLALTKGRLSTLPFSVHNANDQTIFLRAIAKGNELAAKRLHMNGEHKPAAPSPTAETRFAGGFDPTRRGGPGAHADAVSLPEDPARSAQRMAERLQGIAAPPPTPSIQHTEPENIVSKEAAAAAAAATAAAAGT